VRHRVPAIENGSFLLELSPQPAMFNTFYMKDIKQAIRIMLLSGSDATLAAMAWGFAHLRHKDHVQYALAGMASAEIQPSAVKVMAETGIDISTAKADALDAAPSIEMDIVLCLSGTPLQADPLLPGYPLAVRWNVPDPAGVRGDPETVPATLTEAGEAIAQVARETNDDEAGARVNPQGPIEAVLDKGYHSGAVLVDMQERAVRSYGSEPDRGRRRWKGKPEEPAAVYANRRRIRGDRGKRWLRQRGEKIERSFAHLYETGGLRRVHLRQHPNILKRLLVHGAAFNLGLVMRKIFGKGTPRGLQGNRAELLWAFGRLLSAVMTSPILWGAPGEHSPHFQPSGSTMSGPLEMSISTTGC